MLSMHKNITFTNIIIYKKIEQVSTAAKYPFATSKDGRFCEENFLKLMIGSQPSIEGRSLI